MRTTIPLMLLKIRNFTRHHVSCQRNAREADLRGAVIGALRRLQSEEERHPDPDSLVNAPEWLITLEVDSRDTQV